MINYIKDLFTREFVRNVFHTFLSRGALILISLCSSIIVTRALGPELKGIFFLIVSLIGLGTQIANAGMHSVNIYYSAKEPQMRNALFGNSLLFAIFSGVIVSSLIVLFRSFFMPDLVINPLVYLMIVLCTPLALLKLFLKSIIIGTQEIKLNNYLEITSNGAYLLLIIIAYFAKFISLNAMLLIIFIEHVFSVILLTLTVNKKLFIKFKPSFKWFKENYGYGLKAYAAALLAYMVIRSDIFIINYLIEDKSHLGYYSIAVQLADQFALIGSIVSSVLMPKLSGIKDNSEKIRLHKRTVKLASFAMLIALIPVLLLSKYIVLIMFGNEFLEAVPLFRLLLFAILFLSIESIMAQYLASIGIPIRLVYFWILALCCNIVLNFILIPKYGTHGAAYASIVSYFLIFVLVFLYNRSLKRTAALK